MSDKKLVKSIANNTISETAFNAIAGYMAALDAMTDNARARAASLNKWDATHNYDNTRRAGMRKTATPAEKAAYERLKDARADYAEIIRKDMNTKNAPARGAQSDAIIALFGRGGKNDKSNAAAAFRGFYAAYTTYRAEMSLSDNTPAGKNAISKLINLYSVCFGFTFKGSIGKDIARRTLNLLGVRAANTSENMKGARGVAVFSESQTKRLLIAIASSILNKGVVDGFDMDSILVLEKTARADYAATMRK